MGKRRTWSIILLAAALAAQASAAPTPEEQAKLDALAAAIDGTILFTKGEKVYKMVIGVWTPVEIGDGAYARWSPDGTRIAVFYRGDIFVMDADGGNREFLIGGVIGIINPMDFHTNDEEIIFTQYNYGLRAIRIADKVLRDVATYHRYYGEASVSADGRRMAARHEHDLYAIQVGVGDRKFAAGCSPGVCPNGVRLMNNTAPGHEKLRIRDWDGSNLFEISSSTCQPDDIWDNHHWSNHPDYIAVQGDTVREIYVLQISAAPADQGTRVTWLGNCSYADLYVENVLSISGTVTLASVGLEDVTVSATGGLDGLAALTDDQGNYTIWGVEDGQSYDVTAEALGYSLSEGFSNPVTISGGLTGLGFTATALTFTVSGTVLDKDGNPVEGATVTLSGAAGSDTTDATGSFSVSGVYLGEYVLTTTLPAGYELQSVPPQTVSVPNPPAPGSDVTGLELSAVVPSSDGGDGCGAGGACFALVAMLAAARMLDRRRARVLS